MAYDRFMIAPINGGLQTDQKPWLTPEDSFAVLKNAYIYRSRIRKRPGCRYMNSAIPQAYAQLNSRLRINLGSTDTTGAFSGTVPGTIFQAGQLFSIGNEIFTVYQSGIMLDSGIGGVYATTKTFNTSTGAVVIAGAVVGGIATPVYWYPAQPVTGLPTYQTATSFADPTFAFDTQFAYQFLNGGWSRLGTAVWTGTYNQLFWATNWQGATPDTRYLFVTNYNLPDGLKYWTGTTWNNLAGMQVNEVGDTLGTALMVVVFKNRLVLLSPWINLVGGGNVQYTNMAMWAAYGDPTATDAWRSDLPGQGNFEVAATTEDIISCSFIKDRLTVNFERSTYELAYTGNEADPFVWQKLNDELGTDSTFSTVEFDDVSLSFGNTGIHACNGVNVKRIDQKIPLAIWNLRTGGNQIDLVYGVRDYFAEQTYWSFPSTVADINSSTFNNQILAYNYLTGSWAQFDDSITAFGYYYQASGSQVLWSSTDTLWNNSNVTWGGGNQQILNQVVLAGNQEGYVFIVDIDIATQAPVLQITNIFLNATNNIQVTVINHNLQVGTNDVPTYVYLNNLNGLTGPFTAFYPVTKILDANNFYITAPDLYPFLLPQLSRNYTGGGTIARVPAIDIYTKQFNFYIDKDRNFSIARVDFLVDRTSAGRIKVDYLTGTSSFQGTIAGASATGALLGDSTLTTYPYDANLYPFEQYQDRLWHPIYPIAEGNAVQLRLYFTGTELADGNVFFSDFQMHAMTFFVTPTSYRAQ